MNRSTTHPHRRRTRRRRAITVALAALAAVALGAGGCGSTGDAGHASSAPDDPAVGPLPALPAADPPRLDLPAGAPVTIEIPQGGPAVLHLPEGTDVHVTNDVPGELVEVVLDIPAVSLGFELDATAPADSVSARGQLAELLAGVSSLPGYRLEGILVLGFASSEGDPAHNQVLSAARAGWVHTQFVELGADPGRVTSEGRGTQADRPPTGPGPEDRRVEITVTLSAESGNETE